MTQSSIVSAADYADALFAARKARRILFIVISLLLLGQVGLFFAARYSQILVDSDPANPAPLKQLFQYGIGLIDFLGLILPTLYAVVLLLILNVMLLGRLLGAGHLTKAFFWSIVLILLLFPWQSFLNNPILNNDPSGIRIPGVLYTWTELIHPRLGARFSTDLDVNLRILRWTRFVGFPIVALFILLYTHRSSGRGLRRAIGKPTAPGNEIIPIADR